MKRLLFSIMLLAAIPACKEETTQPEQPRPNEAYARWKSYALHNYTIDQARVCFCINGGETMRVIVRSDTVQSVLRISDSTLLSWNDARGYLTVDSLFGIIRDKSYDSLVIRYHPVFGYPDTLDINPQQHPYDGGVLILTSNLRVP